MDWKIILEIITIPSNTSIMYSLFQEQLILISFFENHLKQGIKVDLKAQTNFYKVKDILKVVRIMTSLKLILFSSKQPICSVYKFVNKDSGRDLPSLYPQMNGLKTTYSLLMGLFPAQMHHFPVTAEKTGKEQFLSPSLLSALPSPQSAGPNPVPLPIQFTLSWWLYPSPSIQISPASPGPVKHPNLRSSFL